MSLCQNPKSSKFYVSLYIKSVCIFSTKSIFKLGMLTNANDEEPKKN